MKTFLPILTLVCCWAMSVPLTAQSTLSSIRTIMQAKCASCHSGATPAAGLDLSGTEAQLYAALVNVNSTMSASGEKLVAAGYPYRSFLLRKVNNGLIDAADAGLTADEGEAIAHSGTTIANNEVELIRQWIYAGAKQNGNAVNKTLIDEYYADGGLPFIERPEAPAAGTGFQVHLGPIFIAPGDEREYAIKYRLDTPSDLEVKRVDVKMPIQSHHFILYKFLPGNGNNVSNGLREVGIFNIPGDGASMVAAWAFSSTYRLPAGTAYKWAAGDVMDLNLHQPNYSETNILPSDVYINVYTQPLGTAVKEMKSDLLTFGSPFFFSIPGNAVDYALEEDIINQEQRNIWNIGPHTHKYGVDFDVWRRNADGSKGEHIFEGQENGYYDWEHPKNHYYEPYYTLPANVGIIHRALYTNTSSNTVTFGLTTDNEMMITYMQYTEGQPLTFVGVPNIAERYCVNADPIVFQPMGGTITGAGTSGNQFLPAAAGVGTHLVTYSYLDPTYNETLTAEYSIEVTAAAATPTITQNDQVLSTDGSYETYQWYLNGNALPNATLNYYVPEQSGSYTVAAMRDGCLVVSAGVQYIASGVGAVATPTAQQLWLYPNPYQQQFKVQYQLSEPTDISIALYNTTGQMIADILPNCRQTTGTYTYNCDTRYLPAGVYFVRSTANGVTRLQQIVQQ